MLDGVQCRENHVFDPERKLCQTSYTKTSQIRTRSVTNGHNINLSKLVKTIVPPHVAQAETMLDTIFCMQPVGDSVSRKGLIDSILMGCIPVSFAIILCVLILESHSLAFFV